jgi:thioredoxin 1
MYILVLGIVAGGLIGFLVAKKGKCTGRSCPITSHPVKASLYGALWGGLLAAVTVFANPTQLRPDCMEGRRIFLPEKQTNKEEHTMSESSTTHSTVTITSKDHFDELVKNAKTPVLIDFWAQWCGPCRAQGPVLDQLGEKAEGKVVVAKVDIDEVKDLATTFKVYSIPTLMIFKDGKMEERLVGFHDLETLMKVLEL